MAPPRQLYVPPHLRASSASNNGQAGNHGRKDARQKEADPQVPQGAKLHNTMEGHSGNHSDSNHGESTEVVHPDDSARSSMSAMYAAGRTMEKCKAERKILIDEIVSSREKRDELLETFSRMENDVAERAPWEMVASMTDCFVECRDCVRETNEATEKALEFADGRLDEARACWEEQVAREKVLNEREEDVVIRESMIAGQVAIRNSEAQGLMSETEVSQAQLKEKEQELHQLEHHLTDRHREINKRESQFEELKKRQAGIVETWKQEFLGMHQENVVVQGILEEKCNMIVHCRNDVEMTYEKTIQLTKAMQRSLQLGLVEGDSPQGDPPQGDDGNEV